MQLISPAEDLPQPKKKRVARPTDLRQEGWSPPARELLSITERETHFWGTWDVSSITQTDLLSPSQSSFFSLLFFMSVMEASGTISLLPEFLLHPGDCGDCSTLLSEVPFVTDTGWEEKNNIVAKMEEKKGKKRAFVLRGGKETTMVRVVRESRD